MKIAKKVIGFALLASFIMAKDKLSKTEEKSKNFI
jgi:hypothetical protein